MTFIVLSSCPSCQLTSQPRAFLRGGAVSAEGSRRQAKRSSLVHRCCFEMWWWWKVSLFSFAAIYLAKRNIKKKGILEEYEKVQKCFQVCYYNWAKCSLELFLLFSPYCIHVFPHHPSIFPPIHPSIYLEASCCSKFFPMSSFIFFCCNLSPCRSGCWVHGNRHLPLLSPNSMINMHDNAYYTINRFELELVMIKQ